MRLQNKVANKMRVITLYQTQPNRHTFHMHVITGIFLPSAQCKLYLSVTITSLALVKPVSTILKGDIYSREYGRSSWTLWDVQLLTKLTIIVNLPRSNGVGAIPTFSSISSNLFCCFCKRIRTAVMCVWVRVHHLQLLSTHCCSRSSPLRLNHYCCLVLLGRAVE